MIKFQLIILYSSAPQYFCKLPALSAGQHLKLKTPAAWDLKMLEDLLNLLFHNLKIFLENKKKKQAKFVPGFDFLTFI
jgi:hypothetical protein